MIKVETLFRNHFDSQNVTNIRFRAFVEDFINKTTAKLSVQPNAVYFLVILSAKFYVLSVELLAFKSFSNYLYLYLINLLNTKMFWL
jgi:hypothetical protein